MKREEAIGVIKKNWPDSSFTMLREALETLIPELKEESEDEKIRKELMDFIYVTTFPVKELKKKERFLDWLEKQGEQKTAVVDFNAKDWYVSKVDGKIHDITYNPTDMVEPKFKVGDEIIRSSKSSCPVHSSTDDTICKVAEIHDTCYILDTKDGKIQEPFKWQDYYELIEQKAAWSEEVENKPNGGIVMEDFNDGNGFYKINLAYLNEEQVEEIEELVKRWDLQPKEDEDESIISDLLDYFDENKCLKHEVNDIVKWLKSIKPQQKGWSENEIKMFDNLTTYLDGRKDLLEDIKSTYISWLKSLKQRYTWKPSEGQVGMLQAIVNEPNNAASESCQIVLKEIIRQMKELME